MGCKLERVSNYIYSQMCFEELWGTDEFHEVGNLCQNQTATHETPFCNRDRLLLKMTLIQRIFQKLSDNQYNCEHLWKICETLVKECDLLSELINCLESSDQLIAFSACKSLVKVVVGLPFSSMKLEWFKEKLLSFDTFKLQTKQHNPCRLLYTMEFLRQIIRFCHGNQDAIAVHTGPEMKVCDCGSPMQNYSVSKCTLINLSLACNKWENILPLYMPFCSDPWRLPCHEVETQDWGTKLSAYSNLSSDIHHKALSSNGLDENVVVSFLMFLLEVVKYIQTNEKQKGETTCGKCADMSNFSGSDEQNLDGNNLSGKCEAASKEQQCLITAEAQVLLKLVPGLVSLLHVPSLSVMCFKSVLNVLWQVFVPLDIISAHKNLTRSHLLVQLSAALISGVRCCLLKKIPQTIGCAGFGGQEWKLFSDKNLPKADCVCLRKLSLLLLKASYTVLQCAAGKPDGVVFDAIMSWSSNLKHLVHGTIELETSKTSPQHLSQQGMPHDLLIKLFSDQDDELVEVLLILLRIYQKVQSFTAEQQIQTWSPFLQLFNPHSLFVSLLDSVCFDHSVLLDFLISPETCFLSYLLSYLRFLLGNWQLFSSSIKHYEELMHCMVKRDSVKSGEDSVKEEKESGHCLHLPLSFDNAPSSKGVDLYHEEWSALPREPAITGDSATTQQCFQARHDALGGLQDIARAYESEESSEESEVVFMETGTNASVPGGNSDEKGIEEADTREITVEKGIEEADTRETTVEKETSHHLDRFGHELDADVRADCVSVSRCEQFTDTEKEVDESDMKHTVEPKRSDLPDVMDRLMPVLIRLRLSVERLHRGGLFPYNAEPLLRAMRTLERFYDGC